MTEPMTDRPAPITLPDVTYRGQRQSDGAGGALISVYDQDGELVGTVAHRAKHSPAGMNWGYAGSGAADCARSLLAHAIGDRHALCPVCQGTDTSGRCESCEAGLLIAPRIYQRFKFTFVAGWATVFTTTRREILGWLTSEFPDADWPGIQAAP